MLTQEEIRKKFLETENMEEFYNWLLKNFNELPLDLQSLLFEFHLDQVLTQEIQRLEFQYRFLKALYDYLREMNQTFRELEDQIRLIELKMKMEEGNN
jgi:hypothetical protein